MTTTRRDFPPTLPCWNDTWAWRGAIAAAPLGALAAILYALLAERAGWAEALFDYALGAAVAAGIGCLLVGILGGIVACYRAKRAERAEADQFDEAVAYPDEPVYPEQSTAPAAEFAQPHEESASTAKA